MHVRIKCTIVDLLRTHLAWCVVGRRPLLRQRWLSKHALCSGSSCFGLQSSIACSLSCACCKHWVCKQAPEERLLCCWCLPMI